MTAQPAAAPRPNVAGPEIRTLHPGDVPALRLGNDRRFSPAGVRTLVESYPGRSVWAPETLEFALLAPWRHRREIAVVQDLAVGVQAEALIAAAIECCREAGDALVLLIELEETRRPSFYARAGLHPLEEVITYELERAMAAPMPSGSLAFEPVAPNDDGAMAELLRIDHAAFPWLWWNSAEEFAAYAETPGVSLAIGRDGERAVAYIGTTSYAGWAHLDRIAVAPEAQGRGFGREALAAAIDLLTAHGARRVALSTQRANDRSQRLYERFGFRRSPGHDYRLYGAPLRPPALDLIDGGAERPPAASVTTTED